MPTKIGKQGRVNTTEILKKISTTKDIKSFITRNLDYFRLPKLNKYLLELCEAKGIEAKEIIKKTDMNRQYLNEILKGKKANPSRDHIICLAFGLGLDYKECQRLLKVARHSQLYSKLKRDAVIIYCLQNKKSFYETEEILFDLKLPTLRGGRYG